MKQLIVLILFVVSVHAQIDDTFCSTDNIVSDDGENKPIPSHNSSERFQVAFEKNSDKNGFTIEVEEFYDGLSNIGISINTFVGQKIYTYSYYDQNELLLVENDKCKVLKLNESFDLTPFFVVTLPDGQEHIVSELGFILLNPQIKIAYLGSKNRVVRGIPVREWRTCLYSKKDDATLKVTISYSNEKSWAPAVTIPGYESVPLQVKIESKNRLTGKINVEYNVYSQFRPGILIEEEDYFTRSGVYCEGRISKKPLPKVPDSFSFILHTATSALDAESLIGTLSASRLEFDYKKKLFRFDYRKNGIRMTEIDDQNTGIKYIIDNYHRNCSIDLLENLNIENNPIEFFQFDRDPPFEYVGQRRVRGINTDVWIAPRSLGKANGTWEWHFMADGWSVQEATAVKTNEPIMLLFNLNIPTQAGIKKDPIYFHLSNFDQTRIDLFDFDVSICENIPNQHLRFTITSDKFETMKKNRESLREGIVLAISDAAKVGLIRLSRVETIFDNKTVFVLFTMLDRSTLGNTDLIDLKVAINNLKSAIINKKMVISFTDENNEKYGVTADVDSLLELDERNGRYVYNYLEAGKVIGYSGGAVAGFVIGFLILGLIIGLVAGVFLILKRNNSIPLPGPLSFFNPNFKAEA